MTILTIVEHSILPDELIIPEVPDLPKDEIVNGLCLPARGGLNKECKNFNHS